MKKTIFALAILAASPALAIPPEPPKVSPLELTQQDMQDLQTALEVVGSHCNGNAVAACQAGADSGRLFEKLKAIFDAQSKLDKKATKP